MPRGPSRLCCPCLPRPRDRPWIDGDPSLPRARVHGRRIYACKFAGRQKLARARPCRHARPARVFWCLSRRPLLRYSKAEHTNSFASSIQRRACRARMFVGASGLSFNEIGAGWLRRGRSVAGNMFGCPFSLAIGRP